MIARYNVKKISDLFTLENRYKTFLQVELDNIKALVLLKIIPNSDYLRIKKLAKINLPRINELEKVTKHDVIAFTRSITEKLGKEKSWFHYGLTSTDVVDTTMSILYAKATDYIIEDINNLLDAYRKKALEFRSLPCIARTHGMHAEITSFGLKFVRFYDELNRDKERLLRAKEELCLVKVSGAVGNFAVTNPRVQNYVAKILNLKFPKISTQVINRDNHTNYLNALALIAAHLENVAVEFRNLSRNEIAEVAEFFTEGQKGSSAMPHKHNPISFENICGLARLIRGYAMSSYDNIPLYHERDISHSSFERIAFPDAMNLTCYILERMTKTIDNLVIFKKNVEKNVNLTKGVVYSQRVLTELVKKGVSREEAYDTIQKIAAETLEGKHDLFVMGLLKNKLITDNFTKIELLKLFDPKYYLRNIDIIYKNVGI